MIRDYNLDPPDNPDQGDPERVLTMKWTMLCKRTNDPKLAHLQKLLDAAGIKNRRLGESFHAPILQVDASRIDDAWEILTLIDDVADDDPIFDYDEIGDLKRAALDHRGRP